MSAGVRISADVAHGAEVHDPSLLYPVGRVVAVVDHGDGRQTLLIDLDEDALRARLAEKRRPF